MCEVGVHSLQPHMAFHKNTFNKLNRKVSLENIRRLCTPMYTYLHNSYSTPAMLYLENGNHMLSQEGVMQGDNAAMAMYADPHDHCYKQ